MSDDPDIKELECHVAQLGEHFDSVRIIASRTQDGQTVTVSSGGGNFYAQAGSVRDWLIRQDAMSRASAVARNDDD